MARYVRMSRGLPVEISDEYPQNGAWNKVDGWMSLRQDIATGEEGQRLATYITALTGKVFLVASEGSSSHPRWYVFEAPCIGDDVSRGLNGDYYPCGKITKITKNWKVTTDSGASFNRVRETSSWKEVRGSFFMVQGIIDERNPHF